MLDLVPMWAAILALAVFMYVLLDGFDLGVGMVFLLRRDPVERQMMIHSVAPVWDFNETWLILGGGGMLAVFPLAFSVIVPPPLSSANTSTTRPLVTLAKVSECEVPETV